MASASAALATPCSPALERSPVGKQPLSQGSESSSPAVSPPAERPGMAAGSVVLTGLHDGDGSDGMSDMMQPLTDADLVATGRTKRRSAKHVSTSQRFQPSGKGSVTGTSVFDAQYSNIYFTRLAVLKQRALAAAAERWAGVSTPGLSAADVSTPGPPVLAPNIRDIQRGERCIVAGTTFKKMKLKPDVIGEIAKERAIQIKRAISTAPHYSDDDTLLLEDDSGRVTLSTDNTDIDLQHFFTGTVVGVVGHKISDDVFQAEAVCYPGLAEQSPLPQVPDGDDKYVAIVSDLQVGKTSTNPLHVQLLVDYLSGHLGGTSEQRFAASIVRVIVAGNSLPALGAKDLAAHTPMGSERQTEVADPVKELDCLLTRLCASVPTDVMPGETDPADMLLPQQPLHRVFFQSSSLLTSLQRTSNPYECLVDGVRLLGTSGQNVADMQKYADIQSIDAMRVSMLSAHLCPTAPDTLAAVPSADTDPFLITETPHVYFAGCQPGLRTVATQMLEDGTGAKVRLVAVPSFHKTGCVALLNLRTLEATSLKIDLPSLS